MTTIFISRPDDKVRVDGVPRSVPLADLLPDEISVIRWDDEKQRGEVEFAQRDAEVVEAANAVLAEAEAKSDPAAPRATPLAAFRLNTAIDDPSIFAALGGDLAVARWVAAGEAEAAAEAEAARPLAPEEQAAADEALIRAALAEPGAWRALARAMQATMKLDDKAFLALLLAGVR